METFGIEVGSLDISAIDVDKESEGYQQLMWVSRDVAVATVRAQTEANVKNIHDMQRVQMENLQETLRIEREEGQYRVHKQTQSANLPSFQIETQAGPFDLAALRGMATAGDLAPSSLVWKEGMADWAPASSVAGLAVLFNNGGATPPPIPEQ